MRAYLIEHGFLLFKDDPEFESYATVYNKNYGYYDEDQFYIIEEKQAIEEAKQHVVECGYDNIYAIVSLADVDDDFDFEDQELGPEEYILDNVVYSIGKINEEIVEDFLFK